LQSASRPGGGKWSALVASNPGGLLGFIRWPESPGTRILPVAVDALGPRLDWHGTGPSAPVIAGGSVMVSWPM
jgi:hypothetical protein